MILSFGTDRVWQTIYTQIRLLQGRGSAFSMSELFAILAASFFTVRPLLFNFFGDCRNIVGVPKFRIFMVVPVTCYIVLLLSMILMFTNRQARTKFLEVFGCLNIYQFLWYEDIHIKTEHFCH